MPGITDPTEAYFKGGTWAWDGTQWRKQPHALGFSDTVAEMVVELDLAAGDSAVDGATVPAGEVWIITNVNIRVDSASITRIRVDARVDGNTMVILDQAAPTSLQFYIETRNVYLGTGDKLSFRVYGATLNDNLYGRYCGYKMEITE